MVRGYSAFQVFRSDVLRALALAERVVEVLPEDDRLRCHEVARIVREVIGFGVVEDGTYGQGPRVLPVDHSWIVLRVMGRNRHVLDPYAVGRLPPVQVAEVGFPLDDPYVAGKPRSDVREDVVQEGLRAVRDRLPRYYLVG